MRAMMRQYLEYILQGAVERRLAAQVESLEPNSNALLLDCGCHAGLNTQRLAKKIGTCRAVGVDYNERMLPDALDRGVTAARCDLNRPFPFPAATFDVITAFDVIEHLVETRLFASEVYRVLAPGGYLLMDTPNLASWHNVFALVLGIQPFSGPNITTMLDADLAVVRQIHRHDHQMNEDGVIEDQEETELRRHIVVLAFRSAVNLLRREGFVIERSMGFGYIPFPPPLARLLVRLDAAHGHHMFIKARKPNA